MTKKEDTQQAETIRLTCGCTYQDKGWLLAQLTECEYHRRKLTAKRPYRPKAECV